MLEQVANLIVIAVGAIAILGGVIATLGLLAGLLAAAFEFFSA